VDVAVEGTTYQAKFAKVAVNVMQPPGTDANVLPDVLRGWYGPNAGQPGTTHRAVFERTRDGYTLVPAREAVPDGDGPRLWASYPRVEAARRLGVDLKGFEAQSGVVDRPGLLLLFVTLDKTGKVEAHQYEDAFLAPDQFRWQSQNRTRRDSRIGRMIAQQGDPSPAVHLFVRATAKRGGRTEPFTYCGLLQFERWDGDNPITVWWQLTASVPRELRVPWRVPSSPSS
jgi:hypothetical protein